MHWTDRTQSGGVVARGAREGRAPMVDRTVGEVHGTLTPVAGSGGRHRWHGTGNERGWHGRGRPGR